MNFSFNNKLFWRSIEKDLNESKSENKYCIKTILEGKKKIFIYDFLVYKSIIKPKEDIKGIT